MELIDRWPFKIDRLHAAFAYQGHAASVKDPAEKAAIRQIGIDEWDHRGEVLQVGRGVEGSGGYCGNEPVG